MTAEETISILKIAIAEVEWNYPMDYAVAIETAIQALEKQIPRKVLTFTVNDGDGHLIKIFKGICPYCQCIVTNEYCSRCGQALDWRNDDGTA